MRCARSCTSTAVRPVGVSGAPGGAEDDRCARDALETLAEELGTSLGHASPDGSVELDAVYCLGLCARAPSLMVDGELIADADQVGLTLSPDEAKEITRAGEMIKAATVEQLVARMVGMKIWLDTPPIKATTVAGRMNCTLEVLMARNITMALVAVFLSGLSSCNSSIAFRPSGVAALPNPSMLADMLSTMEPIAGWSAGTSGNRRTMIGLRPRAISEMRPDSSAIFMMPSHRAIIPIRPMAISTETLAMSMAAWVTASIRPVTCWKRFCRARHPSTTPTIRAWSTATMRPAT